MTDETQFAPSADTLATEVVAAVADAEGVDPTSLGPRLYDAVDPDALRWFFERSRSGDVAVSFEYADWLVRIENGIVTVTDPATTDAVTAGSGVT